MNTVRIPLSSLSQPGGEGETINPEVGDTVNVEGTVEAIQGGVATVAITSAQGGAEPGEPTDYTTNDIDRLQASVDEDLRRMRG